MKDSTIYTAPLGKGDWYGTLKDGGLLVAMTTAISPDRKFSPSEETTGEVERESTEYIFVQKKIIST